MWKGGRVCEGVGGGVNACAYINSHKHSPKTRPREGTPEIIILLVFLLLNLIKTLPHVFHDLAHALKIRIWLLLLYRGLRLLKTTTRQLQICMGFVGVRVLSELIKIESVGFFYDEGKTKWEQNTRVLRKCGDKLSTAFFLL